MVHELPANTGFFCPYDGELLVCLGFVENTDGLGLYVAQVYVCPVCGYRLEREPVYLD